MQVVTPQARNRAGLTLNLVIGVIGSPQALSRLKAKLELAVEDALQGLSQEASHELGIEIGRWNIETSTSQPEGDGSASSGPPPGHSVEQLEAPEARIRGLPEGRIMPMSATSAVTQNFEHERFVVRDISDQYEAPTFDLIFRDQEHGVERCSDSVWSSHEQASVAAEALEKADRRPVHWGVLKSL